MAASKMTLRGRLALQFVRDQIILGNYPEKAVGAERFVGEEDLEWFLCESKEFVSILRKEDPDIALVKREEFKRKKANEKPDDKKRAASRTIAINVIEALRMEGLLVKGPKQSAVVKSWSLEEVKQLLRLRYSQSMLIYCTLSMNSARWEPDAFDPHHDRIEAAWRRYHDEIAEKKDSRRGGDAFGPEEKQMRLSWTNAIADLYIGLAEMANLSVLAPLLRTIHVVPGAQRFEQVMKTKTSKDIALEMFQTSGELLQLRLKTTSAWRESQGQKVAWPGTTSFNYLIHYIREHSMKNIERWYSPMVHPSEIVFDILPPS